MTNQLATSKKMMILLHGVENSGKTATVIEVKDLLEAKLNIKPTNLNSQMRKEILVGFKINGCCVCCSSVGDDPCLVRKYLEKIKEWLCKIGCRCCVIVCTSRTKCHETYKTAVDWARENGFEVCYIEKSKAAANVSHATDNTNVANKIVRRINKFHKAKTRSAK